MKPTHQLRKKRPDKVIVMLVHHTPLFMTACDFFGIEETLVRVLSEDEVPLAFFERQHTFAVESFKPACREVEGGVDICWMKDDIATQRTLMMNPDLWRCILKDYLRRQVEIIHEHDLFVLFHSCGAIVDILPDLIEIGIDGVLPFKWSAEGMDAASIAREFGGHLVFYGGTDVLRLLPFGTQEEVRCEVRKNIDIFAMRGGHVVANSHRCLENIKPENLHAMTEEARKLHPMHAT
ncbi:MAG: uroporphyrinogen decarboxylase family protein [Candidatus Latescibacteria bacterium]|nr:uroporphyrinogen decarboxylase family protein [Candidatus Latescibacterota bacterium]